MLKIDFKKNEKDDDAGLVVNGITDKDSSVSFWQNESYKFVLAHVYSQKVTNQLIASLVQELESHFTHVWIPPQAKWTTDLNNIEILFREWVGSKNSRRIIKVKKLKLILQPDTERWAKPYSLIEYAEAFKQCVKNRHSSRLQYIEEDELISNGFGIQWRMKSGKVVVKDEIERAAQTLKLLCEETEKLLVAKVRKNSVTTFFNFPPAVRTACEQYLLYFVQFLEDLGIKADAEIREDAQRVLFSVTPKDGPSALEQIRLALDIYIKLPAMPNFAASASQHPDLAVQQLHANILHLQSQLTLAKASLQAQNATIEALQLSNYQYRQLLSSEEKPKPKTEPLIGDTVHVTEIEGKGVKVDLPLILNRLKRVFGIGKK